MNMWESIPYREPILMAGAGSRRSLRHAAPPSAREHGTGWGHVSGTKNRLPEASLRTVSKSSPNNERTLFPLPKKSWLCVYIFHLCQILLKHYPLGKITKLRIHFPSQECSLLLALVTEMSCWSPRAMLGWRPCMNCLYCSLINVANILKIVLTFFIPRAYT